MDFFPLFANLRDQPCLVVGGGAVAARKARELVAAGARVTVNAPECTAAMDELLATSPGMQLHRAAFDPALIRAHVLVVAATSDPSVNRAVAEAARNALRLCNVVDDATASSFIVPAIVDRSPLTGNERPKGFRAGQQDGTDSVALVIDALAGSGKLPVIGKDHASIINPPDLPDPEFIQNRIFC